MAADLYKYEYICPVCENSFGSKKRVKEHITNSTDGKHYGINGFNMTKTIQRRKDKDEMTLEEKFVEAARKFDELGHDEAKQVANKAQENTDNRFVSKKHVARAWIDAGYDLDGHMLHIGTAFSDLSMRQKINLALIYYDYGKDPLYENMNLFRSAKDIGLERSDVRNTYRKYYFYLKDKYLPSEIENKQIEIDEYTHEDDSETSSKNEQTQNNTDHTETKMNTTSNEDPSIEHSDETSSILNKAKALSESGVDAALRLEIQEDNFEAIQKLIKNGHEDLAEELYDEE